MFLKICQTVNFLLFFKFFYFLTHITFSPQFWYENFLYLKIKKWFKFGEFLSYFINNYWCMSKKIKILENYFFWFFYNKFTNFHQNPPINFWDTSFLILGIFFPKISIKCQKSILWHKGPKIKILMFYENLVNRDFFEPYFTVLS